MTEDNFSLTLYKTMRNCAYLSALTLISYSLGETDLVNIMGIPLDPMKVGIGALLFNSTADYVVDGKIEK